MLKKEEEEEETQLDGLGSLVIHYHCIQESKDMLYFLSQYN